MFSSSTTSPRGCLLVAASIPAARSTIRPCDPTAGAGGGWEATNGAAAAQAGDATFATLRILASPVAAGAGGIVANSGVGSVSPDKHDGTRARRAVDPLHDARRQPADLPVANPADAAQRFPAAASGRLRLLPEAPPPATCAPFAPDSVEAQRAERDSTMGVAFVRRTREMTTVLNGLAARDVAASDLKNLAPDLHRMADAVEDVDAAYARSSTPFGLEHDTARVLRDVLTQDGFDTLYATFKAWRDDARPGFVARAWALARQGGEPRDYDTWFRVSFAPELRSLASRVIAMQNAVCAAIFCGKDEVLRAMQRTNAAGGSAAPASSGKKDEAGLRASAAVAGTSALPA